MRKKELIKQVQYLTKQNAILSKDNTRLRNLCDLKDSYFMEMISDGLRNGSSLAAKHMAERRSFLNGK